jgi:hypothetical protein
MWSHSCWIGDEVVLWTAITHAGISYSQSLSSCSQLLHLCTATADEQLLQWLANTSLLVLVLMCFLRLYAM